MRRDALVTRLLDAPRRIALAAIRVYQRYLSPHKGFSCAYRVHTGRAGCSALGYRVVRRNGLLGGLVLLRRRTYLCGVVHRRHATPRRPLASQRGDCDCGVPCDLHCDLPVGKIFSNCCDPSDCCSCDWPDRKNDKKKRQQEQYVHIPPHRWPSK